MDFELDPAKASSNLLKHNVGFEEASRVFLDPRRIETFDGRDSYGEDRCKTVGLVGPVLLTVVYAVRGRGADIIRLISARKADSYECSQYHEIWSGWQEPSQTDRRAAQTLGGARRDA